MNHFSSHLCGPLTLVTDFNNFWYTDSWRNLTIADYIFAHFTWKMSLQYLVKCKSHFSITLITDASWLFKVLLDKNDSSSHNTADSRDLNRWTTASGAWCSSECTRFHRRQWCSKGRASRPMQGKAKAFKHTTRAEMNIRSTSDSLTGRHNR